MTHRVLITLLLWVVATLLTACDPAMREELLQATSAALSAAQSTIPAADQAEDTAVVEPAIRFALAAPSQSGSLAAVEIFNRISPSVAFIETPIATGSGVLVEHGYILSNAHVVWPYQTVRVVFPDGSEYVDTPVQSWDLTADLALIGPLDVPQPPVALTDGGALAIGSDVYLIGYPAEIDKFPQPSITSGILSRVRKWDAIDYTFYQVDATTVGGQSGGILVTHQGDVIGVSTFYYGGFGLAGSVADTLQRLNAMLGNESTITTDMRLIKGETPRRIISETLLHDWDRRVYVLNEPVDTEVALRFSSASAKEIAVYTLDGTYIDSQEVGPDDQQTTLTFTVEEAIPYLIEVTPLNRFGGTFILTSSHTLATYTDPDDQQQLTIGESYMGSIEITGDYDYYALELEQDQIVEITVDALEIDPYVSIRYEAPLLEEYAGDDDGGGGIFDTNAKLVYRAPEGGTYRVSVETYDYDTVGTYFLTIHEAAADAELTKGVETNELYPGEYGPLTWYESEEANFAVMRPTLWSEIPNYECVEGAVLCYSGPALYLLIEDPLSELPKSDRSQEGYVALLEDVLASSPEISIEEITELQTLQALDATVVKFTTQFGRYIGKRFVYVDEREQLALNLSIVTETEKFPELEPTIDEFFASFRLWPRTNRERDAVYQLDRGQRALITGAYEDALTALNQSIDRNDGIAEAYALRAWTHHALHDSSAALTDIEAAIALDAENPEYPEAMAQFYWQLGDFAAALTQINHTIALDAERANAYNMRALIYVALEEYDAALDDIEINRKLNGGILPVGVLDTRGFIYLMQGDYRLARRSYDQAARKGYYSAYLLLGAGVAYAHLDGVESGEQLIRDGYAELERDDTRMIDPQLAALLEMAGQFVERE